MKRCVLIGFAAMLALASHAQTRTSTTISAAQASPTQADGVDRSAAQYWGLTLDDYHRYQSLMKGVRGALSDPRITPIEVLGIHARDDAERRKYAEMFARLMSEDTQRVLQFQLEYDRAFRRLHPKLVALDLGPGTQRGGAAGTSTVSLASASVAAGAARSAVSAMSRPPAVSSGDRLLVFTREGCAPCDELVQRAVPLARQGIAVDLYLVGARSADDAQRYARRLALDADLVATRRITLNLDGGTFSRTLPQQSALPALVRKRGQSVTQLATSELAS